MNRDRRGARDDFISLLSFVFFVVLPPLRLRSTFSAAKRHNARDE